MSRTISKEVFTFDELSKGAQKRALDNLRDINVDYDDWAEFLLEQYKEEGVKKGFGIDQIYYSGFSSQGDGASWDGDIDVPMWMKTKGYDKKYPVIYRWAEEMCPNIRAKVEGPRYVHSEMMSFYDGDELLKQTDLNEFR